MDKFPELPMFSGVNGPCRIEADLQDLEVIGAIPSGMNRNIANTNVLIHHGVLLALREDSPPVALDPVTLETIGNWDFHGTLPGRTCSAHCKIDHVTGNLVGFGYDAKGDFSLDTVYFEVSTEGRVIHETWFKLPYYEMQHDCGITRDYIVFPVVPIMGAGNAGLQQGLPYYGWLLSFGPGRNALGHVDLAAGATEQWTAPPTLPLQEPCFIPRAPGAGEGDGWIVQAATNAGTMLTEVNLFEATDIARGPIATIKMPLRLKPAYHGSWADIERIKPVSDDLIKEIAA